MKAPLLLAVVFLAISCGIRTSQSYYDQGTQILRTEGGGTYVIRTSGNGRNAAKARQEAKKLAVYEVIFNGVPSASSTVSPLKPLLLEVNAKEKYQDYFNAFFADDGEYENYISSRDKKAGSSSWMRNNNEVKCQTVVSVDVSALKAKLVQDNIIKR